MNSVTSASGGGHTEVIAARAASTMSAHTANYGPRLASVEEIWQALDLLRTWVEDCDYRGYEPFDGLSSWARPLAFGNQLAERILQQSIRQCPFNLRPILGVRPQDSTKGRGSWRGGT